MSFPHPDKASPGDVAEMLTLPDYFGLSSGHPVREDPEHWTLGPVIRTRDSSLLTEVNADALEAELSEHPEFEEDYQITHCGHFACGWVDHLSFRALTPEGKPTAVWRWLAEWFARLEHYACADDAELSKREYEGALENIASIGEGRVTDGAPEDWPKKVWQWLWDHKQDELEASDGDAPYPSREAVHEAMRALGIYDTDWD